MATKLQDNIIGKSSKEMHKYFLYYLRQHAIEKRIPLEGLFELTPRCTLNCRMCYIHLCPSQMCKQELRVEEWISLIEDACNAGMMRATLTGGECTLYYGFKDIYKALINRGILVTILTNGTLLDQALIDWLSQFPPEAIQVSVYGCSTSEYESITGDGSAFFKVDRALDLLNASTLNYYTTITVIKPMFLNFSKILDYCYSKAPLKCTINTKLFEANIETGRNVMDLELSLDEKIEIYKLYRIRQGIRPYSCENAQELLLSEVENRPQECSPVGMQCSAGRYRFALLWDGTMTPCNCFSTMNSYPLKDGFLCSWKYINQLAENYLSPIECMSCSHRSICMKCPAAHYAGVGKQGHADTKICEEGRRIVREGLAHL